jgi:ERCC4-type nuclease
MELHTASEYIGIMINNNLLSHCIQKIQELPIASKSSTLADTLEYQDIFLDGKLRKQIPLVTTQQPRKGLHLWIDGREKELVKCLSHLEFVSAVVINPGDAMISYNGHIVALYERKRTDLLDSVYSNHLSSQRSRLLITSLRQPTTCQVHLIHEKVNYHMLNDKEKIIVLSCQTNMIHRDAIFWRETESVLDTAILLLRDMKGIADFHGQETTLTVRTKRRLPSSSGGAMSGRPQDILTAESLYLTQLTCIPRVSHNVAHSISNVFPSWQKLLQRYADVGSDNLVREIADIKVDVRSRKKHLSTTTTPVTARRIGPKLAQSIVALHCAFGCK